MADEINITVIEQPIEVAIAITESPIAVTVAGTQGIEEAPIDGVTYGRKNAAWQAVVTSVAWGAITGTLSNQTDLQTALDAKEPTITILAASKGGTGIAAGASASLTLPNLAITLGGGGAAQTYTLPATGGTFALLNAANVFTALNNFKSAVGIRLEGTGTNTDIIDLIPGVASSTDRLDFKAVNTNRGVSFQLNPNGTSTNSKVSLANAESSTDFSSIFIETGTTTAYISAQHVGTPASAIVNLMIGAGISGGHNWTTVVIPGAIVTLENQEVIKAGADATVNLRLQRFSATGRSQITYEDQSGSQLWRMGTTGAGGTDFNFFNGTTTNLAMQRAGTSTFTGTVFMDGISDQIQLRVQGHSTQTTNLVTIENSSGTVLGGFQGRGTFFSDFGLDADSLFIGRDSGNLTATGTRNTGVGRNTLAALTSGAFNVALGYGALQAVTTGQGNFGIGFNALNALNTGSSNFGLGHNALKAITTQSENVAIGASAALDALMAQGIGIGAGALGKSRSNQNIAIGVNALHYPLTTSGNNVAIGYQSMLSVASATGIANNVAIGYETLKSVTSGASNNVVVGYQSGFSLTSGDANIFLGFSAGYRQTTNSNLFIVDNLQRADAATEDTNAIVYGTMAAAPANQTLKVNAVLNVTETIQIDGTQVVTNRVIDARIDDAINSGDATTDGVIDAIRDALVTHGLIAAA